MSISLHKVHTNAPFAVVGVSFKCDVDGKALYSIKSNKFLTVKDLEEAALCNALFEVIKQKLTGNPKVLAVSGIGAMNYGCNNNQMTISCLVKPNLSSCRKASGLIIKNLNPHTAVASAENSLKQAGVKHSANTIKAYADKLLHNIQSKLDIAIVGKIKYPEGFKNSDLIEVVEKKVSDADDKGAKPGSPGNNTAIVITKNFEVKASGVDAAMLSMCANFLIGKFGSCVVNDHVIFDTDESKENFIMNKLNKDNVDRFVKANLEGLEKKDLLGGRLAYDLLLGCDISANKISDAEKATTTSIKSGIMKLLR